MATNPRNPADSWVKLTKGQALANGICRGLWVGTAGTANLKDAAGTDTTNVPLLQGYNPFKIKELNAGGSADDIWALY